jgi:hypothetical protein
MNCVGAVSHDLNFDVARAKDGFFDEDGAAGDLADAAGVGFGDFGGGVTIRIPRPGTRKKTFGLERSPGESPKKGSRRETARAV